MLREDFSNLVDAVEALANRAFDMAQAQRKNSNAMKRMLKAYADLRDAADEVRLAKADM